MSVCVRVFTLGDLKRIVPLHLSLGQPLNGDGKGVNGTSPNVATKDKGRGKSDQPKTTYGNVLIFCFGSDLDVFWTTSYDIVFLRDETTATKLVGEH